MRVVWMCLLLMAAAPTRAEWVQIGKSAKTAYVVLSDETVYYIDPASIVKEGNFRRVWEIHDRNGKGAQGERSVLASVQYDCAAKRMRILKATGRSMRMARREIIPLSRILDDWIVLRPGGDDDIFFKILNTVCAP